VNLAMLKPSKFSHPDKTLIHTSHVLLKYLKRVRIETFDKLRSVLEKADRDLDSLFIPALELLFLLGIVDYSSKNDSFIYTGK